MPNPIDLEIVLRRRDDERYSVDLRGSAPDSDVETRPLRDHAVTAHFDLPRLRRLELDAVAYGRALAEMLFADSLLVAEVDKARAAAQAQAAPLRLRIDISPDAEELHALRWETLRDPRARDAPLLTTGEQLFFSRYLASADWQPVRLRARAGLRALVAIANPSDLAGFGLAPLDVAREVQLVRDSVGDIALTVLGGDTRVTLAALARHLHEGYDILYLMAHAKQRPDGTTLYLENDRGEVETVPGGELATRIEELVQRPRLIVLASCQSAGDAGGAALRALGPRLATAGAPAVIAMQGSVSVTTVEALLPAFFAALQQDGQIDRALAVARGQVRDRHDFWMPALFMRLKSGRLWYTPGFAADERGRADEKWEPLLSSLRDGECTPILGPDLAEGLIGPRRDLARKLADDFHFPLAPHNREDLPQVAQFLAVHKSMQYLPHAIIQYLCEAIRRRQGAPPEAMQSLNLEKASRKGLVGLLDTLLREVWAAEQARNPAEPHRVLASLPLPIYLTADPSDLIVQALLAAGKKPEVMFCPWNEYTRKAPTPYKRDPDYEPSIERPLVYRLFGSLQEPESLVLTEDSHFDYLIGVTQNKDLIPTRIRSMLADTALLFLGFRPDDWAFRVFFRNLMNQEGGTRRTYYAHIAVQVAPEEGRILLPKLAQRYLEDYFNKGAFISVYWGGAEDFVRELYQRW